MNSREPYISVEDAQSVLTHAVDLAEAGDETALCDMGGSVGICHDFLQDVGGIQTVPTSRPVTIGTRLMPDLYCGEKLSVVGGRVLVIKGVNISGNGYNTDFMVMRWNGKLVPYNPVYWSGMRVSTPHINCQTGGASGSTSGTPTSP